MKIDTALQKVEFLNIAELNHCIQRCNMDVEHYKKAIANYPEDRMEKYGIPYLKVLQQKLKVFEEALEERNGN